MLLAIAPVASAQGAPDLAIVSADEWSFAEEGRVLVLRVQVANQGEVPSPETVVRAFAWEEFETGVPSLDNGEDIVVELFMPIPREMGGNTAQIALMVDPDEQFFDLERDNNRYETPLIEFPEQPQDQPRDPDEPQPESELFVEGIAPNSVRQDEEFTLEVFGGGFQPGVEVFFDEGGLSGSGGHGLLRPVPDVSAQFIELGEVNFRDETYLTLDGYVPPDAPVGARVIVVVNPDGTSVRVEGMFTVASGSGGGQPSPGGGGIPPGVLIGGAVVGVLVLGGLGLGVSVAMRPSRKSLQQKAKQQNPPDNCTPGARWVKATEVEVKPGRWHVAELSGLLYDAQGGIVGKRYQASKELLNEINEAIREARRAPDTGATVERAFMAGAEAFADQMVSMAALEPATRDVSLDAKLEGGEAEFTFEEYRCKGAAGASQWVKVREWKATIQATDRHAGTVAGPRTGEAHDAYVARNRREVGERLRQLVLTVANMGL
jgi:hypothetical protein